MEIEVSINKQVHQTQENFDKLMKVDGIKYNEEFQTFYVDINGLHELDKVLTSIWKVFGMVDTIIQPNPLELFIDFN